MDDIIYGPVELPTLLEWIRDERVTQETWIHNLSRQHWSRAGRLQC